MNFRPHFDVEILISKREGQVVAGQIILRPAEPMKNYSQAIKIMSYIACAINDVKFCTLPLVIHLGVSIS